MAGQSLTDSSPLRFKMEGSSDVVDWFEKKFRQRIRLVTTLVLAGIAAETTLLVAFFSTEQRGTPLWVFAPPGIAVFLGVPALVWAMRRTGSRYASFLRAIRPRMLNAGFSGGAAVPVVFDNGVVASVIGSNVSLRLYDTPSGSPVIPQTVNEANRLRRGSLRMRMVGVVTPNRGPKEFRERLSEIQRRFDVQRSRAFLRQRPATSQRVMETPARISGLVLMDPKWFEKGDRWIAEIDHVRAFLEDLWKTSFSPEVS